MIRVTAIAISLMVCSFVGGYMFNMSLVKPYAKICMIEQKKIDKIDALADALHKLPVKAMRKY